MTGTPVPPRQRILVVDDVGTNIRVLAELVHDTAEVIFRHRPALHQAKREGRHRCTIDSGDGQAVAEGAPTHDGNGLRRHWIPEHCRFSLEARPLAWRLPPMRDVDAWVMAVFTVLIGLAGLFVASRAVDDVTYAGGLALFLFAVFFVMSLVNGSSRRR